MLGTVHGKSETNTMGTRIRDNGLVSLEHNPGDGDPGNGTGRVAGSVRFLAMLAGETTWARRRRGCIDPGLPLVWVLVWFLDSSDGLL